MKCHKNVINSFNIYLILVIEMKKYFYKVFSISLLIITITFLPVKSYASSLPKTDLIFLAQQKAIINYEKSQPSAIDNPVVDPNFNVMRTSDMNTSSATYFVVGLIVIAAIVPLATWFLSKSRTN